MTHRVSEALLLLLKWNRPQINTPSVEIQRLERSTPKDGNALSGSTLKKNTWIKLGNNIHPTKWWCPSLIYKLENAQIRIKIHRSEQGHSLLMHRYSANTNQSQKAGWILQSNEYSDWKAHIFIEAYLPSHFPFRIQIMFQPFALPMPFLVRNDGRCR